MKSWTGRQQQHQQRVASFATIYRLNVARTDFLYKAMFFTHKCCQGGGRTEEELELRLKTGRVNVLNMELLRLRDRRDE